MAVVEKALQYAYRDRRNRKRSFRALWIQRINAAASTLRSSATPERLSPCMNLA